jgi:hypothetical protein
VAEPTTSPALSDYRIAHRPRCAFPHSHGLPLHFLATRVVSAQTLPPSHRLFLLKLVETTRVVSAQTLPPSHRLFLLKLVETNHPVDLVLHVPTIRVHR